MHLGDLVPETPMREGTCLHVAGSRLAYAPWDSLCFICRPLLVGQVNAPTTLLNDDDVLLGFQTPYCKRTAAQGQYQSCVYAVWT